MIIVADLDGTLASNDGREHLKNEKQWTAYHHAGCFARPLLKNIQALHRLLDPGLHKVIPELFVMTGRTDNFRFGTMTWLAGFNLRPKALMMRGVLDQRHDIEVKGDWAASLDPDGVLVVLEDRDRVVKMWRDLGFNCWQVAHGAY